MKVLISEDGPCPHEDCTGTLFISRQGDCTCHITPPCGSCVEAPLECNKCHDVFDWYNEDIYVEKQ